MIVRAIIINNMNDTFINRKKELTWLEERYKQAEKEGQLLIIYGKRRVGKTELVKHFAKNKPFVYYVAEKQTATEQLRQATRAFAEGFGAPELANVRFNQWRELFAYIARELQNKTEPVIVVVDEFPYLAESDEGMSSYFQAGWGEYLQDKKIVLILMGSSIAMMYKHALVYSAPLYGRRTGQWLLQPFTFVDTKKFYPNAPFEKVFPLYALSGGIPAYARVFDGELSLEENLKQFVFPEGRFLSVEPELLLSEEFDDPRSYLTLLKAIGLGRTKFTEIVQESQLPTTALPGYIKTLINLRLIVKETPVTDPIPEKSKKGSYSLADSFLRLYFGFIYPNISFIKAGNYDAVFKQHGQTLTKLIAKAYEDASAEFIQLAELDGALPHFEELGRWWDKNTEIDVVGLNKQDNTILFVETKWNTKPIGTEVLNNLRKKSQQVQWGNENRKEYYALIAKGGFTDELINIARKENVVLIQEDKLL